MKNIIYKLYNKQIDARGLALFRIMYSLVLLAEIIHLFYFRHLIFDIIPFIQSSETNVSIGFVIWMLSVVGLLFGIFTRTNAIINYVCSLFFIATIKTYEYHMFYAYMSINFLMMFIPVSRQWSIDRLFKKIKYSNTTFSYSPPQTVSSLAYLFPVFLAIGLVYYDSILYKLNDSVWLKGLGVWLPASLPMITSSKLDWLINSEILVKFLGYFTILFELIFVFIMWNKRFRWFCLIVGLGLHIGIFVDFPIPFFALGISAVYILMIPVGVYKKLDKLKLKQPLLYFYYDAECPLCIRTKIVIQHFDVFRAVSFLSIQGHAQEQILLKKIDPDELYTNIHSISEKGKVHSGVDTYIQVFNAIVYLKPISWIMRVPGIYHVAKLAYEKIANNRITERCTEESCGYTPPVVPSQDKDIKLLNNLTVGTLKQRIVYAFFVMVIITQFIISYNSSLTVKLRSTISLTNSKADKVISDFSNRINSYSKSILGITHHPVFLESHFKGYNHIIKISYCNRNKTETTLPIITDDGMPGSYNHGFNWCKWTFRVNGPKVKMMNLDNGARSFTAFWAYKNKIDLKNDSFKVYVKKIMVPLEWRKNYLRDELETNGWVSAGTIYWTGKMYHSRIKEIETI